MRDAGFGKVCLKNAHQRFTGARFHRGGSPIRLA